MAGYERKGDRFEWKSDAGPARGRPTLRAGMDVEILHEPGEWMIVGFDDRWVRCVSIDCPGEVLRFRPGAIRPIWREGVNCTPIEALAEGRVA